MKIIIDGSIYSGAPHGGAFIYLEELLKRITVMSDLETEVYIPKDAVAPSISDQKRVHRDRLPTGGWLPPGRVRSFLGKVKRIVQSEILQRKWGRIDSRETLYHSPYYTPSPWNKIPQVYTIYDLISELFPEGGSALTTLKQKAIAVGERFIAISEQTKRDLHKVYGVPLMKIDVVPLAVDTLFFSRRILPETKDKFLIQHGISSPYLLYVGGRLHHKNFRFLLETYASSELKNNFPLVIAGTSWLPEEERLITSWGVKSKIKLVHKPSPEALRVLYQGARAFIYPSLYEGFGLPILEAFASRVPLVAARAGSIPEIAGDGAAFFDPKDPAALLRAVDKVSNSEAAGELVRKGVRRLDDFSWDLTAEKTVAVYRKVLPLNGLEAVESQLAQA